MPQKAETFVDAKEAAESNSKADWLLCLSDLVGNQEVTKPELTARIHKALHEKQLGGVQQTPGSSGTSFAFICKSSRKSTEQEGGDRGTEWTDQEAEEGGDVEGDWTVSRPTLVFIDRTGLRPEFRERTIPFDDALFSALRIQPVLKLRTILRANGALIEGTKQEIIERIMTGAECGRLPNCRDCGGMFHDFDRVAGGFPCGGYYDQHAKRANSCSQILRTPGVFSAFVVSLSEKVTDEAQPPHQCDFHLQFASSKKQFSGFHIVKSTKHHAFHSIGCTTAVAIKGSVIAEKVERHNSLARNGQSAMSRAAFVKSAGLDNISASTVRYHIEKDRAAQFSLPRKDADKLLLPFLESLCAQNPSTRVLLVVKPTGSTEVLYYELDSGGMRLLGDEFFKVIIDTHESRGTSSLPLPRLALMEKKKLDAYKICRDRAIKANAANRTEMVDKYEAQVVRVSQIMNELLCACQEPDCDGVGDGCRDEDLFVDDTHAWDSCEFEGGVIVNVTVAIGSIVEMVRFVGKNLFSFDGAHVKDGLRRGDLSKGQLLIVEAEDSLGHIYPAAISFCFSESTDNFLILFQTLARSGLDLNNNRYLLMSDRGRAGIKAVKQHLPKASLRFCCEHILRNVANKIKRKLTEKEKSAIRQYFRASTPVLVDAAQKRLRNELTPTAAEYLIAIPSETIVTESFITRNVPTHGRINNNSVESENSRQGVARRQPTVVETLREVLVSVAQLIGRRQLEAIAIADQAKSWVILPGILKKVQPFVSMSSTYVVHFAGSGTYNVSPIATNSSSFAEKWTVETALLTCTCGLWQDLRYPCEHAVAVKVHGIPEIQDAEYYEKWFGEIFRVANYRKAFQVPLVVPALGDLTKNAPPVTRPTLLEKPGPGRPRQEKRMRSNGEY